MSLNKPILAFFLVIGLLLSLFLTSSSAQPRELEWNHVWGGSELDVARAVTMAPDGTVLIAGGTESFGPPGGGDGDAFVATFSWATGHYTGGGTWGGPGYEYAWGVATPWNTFSNFYLSGNTNSFGSTYDAFLARFGSDGAHFWSKTWDGGDYDGSWDVAVDPNGYIYIVGETHGLGEGFADAFLAKFSESGAHIWSRTWGGVSYDSANAVTTDASGNVYVVGSTGSFNPEGKLDVFVLKFSSSGGLLWSLVWGLEMDDTAWDVEWYDGVVYVSGFMKRLHGYPSGSVTDDSFVIALDDSNGNVLWARGLTGADRGVGSSRSFAVSVDEGGVAVVTQESSGLSHVYVFDRPSGRLLWARSIIPGLGTNIYARAYAATFKYGKIVVAGTANTESQYIWPAYLSLSWLSGDVQRSVGAVHDVTSQVTVQDVTSQVTLGDPPNPVDSGGEEAGGAFIMSIDSWTAEEALANVDAWADWTGTDAYKQVAVVVGAPVNRPDKVEGPYKQCRTTAVAGAMSIAGALGARDSFLDDEAVEYDPAADEVNWIGDFVDHYGRVAAVGGPIVHMIVDKYMDQSVFPFSSVTEGGHELYQITVNENGIARVYLNRTDKYMYIEYEDGSLDKVGKVGEADFAVVEMFHDSDAEKWVLTGYGITKYGSLASGRWLGSIVGFTYFYTFDAKAVVLLWEDSNGDGMVQSAEVNVLARGYGP